MMTAFLSLNNIDKSFSVNRNLFNIFSKPNHFRKVIDNISLEVGLGEVLVIAGESGSGKTTLAKLIMGSIVPDRGTIFF